MLVLNLLRVRFGLKSWGASSSYTSNPVRTAGVSPPPLAKNRRRRGQVGGAGGEDTGGKTESVQEEAQGDSDSRSPPTFAPLLFPRPPHATRGTCHPPRSRGIRSVRIPPAAHARAALRPLWCLQRRLGRAGQRRSPRRLRQ